jgi:hypothetical protein
LNGVRVSHGTITTPTWGLWSGDLELSTDEEIGTTATVVVGNLTLTGFVFRGAPFTSSRSVRVAGGAGGWRRTVAARQYSLAGGVPLSMVLRDLAAETGESVVVANDGAMVGSAWVRETGPASRVLRQLVGLEWWVDAAGVTRLGARPSSRIASDYLVAKRRAGLGAFTVATEDLVAWQPGATFTNALVPDVQTVASTTLHLDLKGKMRLEVLAA